MKDIDKFRKSIKAARCGLRRRSKTENNAYAAHLLRSAAMYLGFAEQELHNLLREFAPSTVAPKPKLDAALTAAYRLLGLKPGASADSVKTAYKKLAMKFHPDRGGDEKQMRELNLAYERILKTK